MARFTNPEQLPLPLEPSAIDSMTTQERRRIVTALSLLLLGAVGVSLDEARTDER